MDITKSWSWNATRPCVKSRPSSRMTHWQTANAFSKSRRSSVPWRAGFQRRQPAWFWLTLQTRNRPLNIHRFQRAVFFVYCLLKTDMSESGGNRICQKSLPQVQWQQNTTDIVSLDGTQRRFKIKQSRKTKRWITNVESQYWRQMLTQLDKAIDLSLRLKPGGVSFNARIKSHTNPKSRRYSLKQVGTRVLKRNCRNSRKRQRDCKCAGWRFRHTSQTGCWKFKFLCVEKFSSKIWNLQHFYLL